MARKQFQTKALTRDVVEFDVDGDTYHFVPPKRGSLLMRVVDGMTDEDPLAGVRTMLDWLGSGLPDDESDRLVGRLRDPDDDFDVDGLSAVVQWLVAEAADRPTQ